MTNSIGEIEHSQVILVSGSNTTVGHPQVARRIYAAVDQGAKLIVIDPRSTRIARFAHLHLRLKSGTDIPLLNGIMRCILDENLLDELFIETHTENFASMREQLLRLDLDEVVKITGVDKQLIVQAARIYASAQRATICYCLGVTQHICGTANVQSYANLAMMTGHVEREFTGVDPLRGQNNVQGACDMGGLPNVFPGYQRVDNIDVRQKFERAWGVTLPATPGRSLLEMTHSATSDNENINTNAKPKALQAMFIVGENPMLSDPVLDRVEHTLRCLDFLVVADIFLTDTAKLADVVFPAASFAEKNGTVTNSERRVQIMHQAIPPIGDCKTDSQIIMELSRRMGYPMNYESAAEVMEEICLLTPIYGGIYHDRLINHWGLQWPCTDRNHPGTQFLHKDGFTRGRGRFIPAEHVQPAELVDDDYPYMLITGRSTHHYHTGTMTRHCSTLNREHDKPWIDIHPDDANHLNITAGMQVVVSSRRGQCCFNVKITDSVKAGDMYCDFHFHEAAVNRLTLGTSDPIANCPELKRCAVKIEQVKL